MCIGRGAQAIATGCESVTIVTTPVPHTKTGAMFRCSEKSGTWHRPNRGCWLYVYSQDAAFDRVFCNSVWPALTSLMKKSLKFLLLFLIASVVAVLVARSVFQKLG